MAKATRAPRGTKILAKAFFAAADEIPEPQRAEVVKAALALIRDELKAMREKTAIAKTKAKEKAGKTATNSGRMAVGIAKVPGKTQKKPAVAEAKVPAKRSQKATSKAAEQTRPDQPAETIDQPDV